MPSALHSGFVSRFNASYYCTVKTVELFEDSVAVDFVVNGDDSLGPLQRPEESTFMSTDGTQLDLRGVEIFAESNLEISGRLTYERPAGVEPPFLFSYGCGGYSIVAVAPEEGDKVEEGAFDGGVVSRFNAAYFCTVTSVALNEGSVVIDFIVNGDNSLGPLQRPEESSLMSTEGTVFGCRGVEVFVETPLKIAGRLTYDRLERVEPPFFFSYGAGGYSVVEVAPSGGDDDGDAFYDEKMGEAQ